MRGYGRKFVNMGKDGGFLKDSLFFTNVSFACPSCMLKYAILTQNRVEICNQFDIRRYLRYCRGKWESQFNSFLHGVIIACIELEETR